MRLIDADKLENIGGGDVVDIDHARKYETPIVCVSKD